LASNDSTARTASPALGLRPLLAAARNPWDVVLLPLAIAAMFLFAWGVGQMAVPYVPGERLAVSLDAAELPYYALRTSLRMGMALVLSLVFTVVYAHWAAASGRVLRKGRPLRGPEPGIAMVFQSFALLPWLDVLGNVELGLEALGVAARSRRSRALAIGTVMPRSSPTTMLPASSVTMIRRPSADQAAAVLHRFGHMRARHVRRAGEIGDRAGQPEHAVISARGQP